MSRKYLFSDETGDMQFMQNGKASRYFAVGTLLADAEQAQELRLSLMHLRDDLAWRSQGLDSCFHASPDKQEVRDAVFGILKDLDLRFDITILEKRKAQPKLYVDYPTFYKYAWYYHLKYIAPQIFVPGDSVQVVAAELGTKRNRTAFRAAVNEVMKQCLPNVKHVLAFWRDESDFGLQAADYFSWAVYRKWETGDLRSYNLIKNKVFSEYDLFSTGKEFYY